MWMASTVAGNYTTQENLIAPLGIFYSTRSGSSLQRCLRLVSNGLRPFIAYITEGAADSGPSRPSLKCSNYRVHVEALTSTSRFWSRWVRCVTVVEITTERPRGFVDANLIADGEVIS